MRATQWRKLPPSLISAFAFLLLVGCGGGSTPATDGSTGEVAASQTPTASPSATATATTLDAALVQQLIDIANATGYGPADETFANVMAVVCRDVESGHATWSEVIAQDVADGATGADAKRLYRFVRDQFCPALPAAAEENNPPGDKSTVNNGTRGLGSTLGYLDANWTQGDAKTCRSVFGASMLRIHAYSRNGAVICVDEPVSQTWGETVIDLDVVFKPAVSEEQAGKIASTLLPEDTTLQKRVKLTNPGWAARKGSCVSLVFESSTLGQVIRSVDPDWSDVSLANATLYSNTQTDYGSGSSFDGTVRGMSLGIGGTSKKQSC